MMFSKYFKLKPLSFGVATATYLVDPEESHGVEVVLAHEEKISGWERILEKNFRSTFSRSRKSGKRDLPGFMHPASFKKCARVILATA